MVQTNSLDSETSRFDLSTYLTERRQLVEAAIDQAVPLQYPETLYESMRYSLLAGGSVCAPFCVWPPVNWWGEPLRQPCRRPAPWK
jgi:geranylgeranyl diphosphate synthase type II